MQIEVGQRVKVTIRRDFIAAEDRKTWEKGTELTGIVTVVGENDKFTLSTDAGDIVELFNDGQSVMIEAIKQ